MSEKTSSALSLYFVTYKNVNILSISENPIELVRGIVESEVSWQDMELIGRITFKSSSTPDTSFCHQLRGHFLSLMISLYELL